MTLERIDIDDPEVDGDYAQRLLYRGELFTGEAEEHLDGCRVGITRYTDGIKDGPYRHWYKSGVLQAEGVMRMGFLAGESLRWHANGTLAKKMISSEDGRFLLASYEWDEDGLPTRTWERTEG
ncbi:toxin-antitoxin system YwqK family antitoxin [Streptomyces sp. NPDC059851]|uniref:toxin-antitoxin system YwqK family antitoxin n=1 Tax=Streptomyces sp. NPDC059851 TaxID=3346971 RepID=UPI00364A0EBA